MLLEEVCRTLPGVSQENPWIKESLDAAEQVFLDRRRRGESVDEELYEAFLGSDLVHLFDGPWASLTAKSPHGETETGYAIVYDRSEHGNMISSKTTIAELFETGTHWSTMHETTRRLLQR